MGAQAQASPKHSRRHRPPAYPSVTGEVNGAREKERGAARDEGGCGATTLEKAMTSILGPEKGAGLSFF
jgi:hypothetical protein